MKTITLDLAGSDFVRGALYRNDDPDALTDDMLFVQVGDYGVDVSWYPEHDPTGKYVVTVFRGQWENQILQRKTREPAEVSWLVEQYVQRLREPYVPLSDAPVRFSNAQKSSIADVDVVWDESRQQFTELVA